MKKCKKCGSFKDESLFYKEQRNKYGLMGCCKICYNKYQRRILDKKIKARRSINKKIDTFPYKSIEKWMPIKGFETAYLISDYGRVKSLARLRYSGNGSYSTIDGKILRCPPDSTGYRGATLSFNKKKRKDHIHRFVAEAFIENMCNYPCVNHKDGNKLNNRVDNLEWCTYSHNNLHAYHKKLKIPYLRNGENNPRNLLSNNDVIKIKKMLHGNLSLFEIANYFNVSKGCISSIKSGQTWSWIKESDLR